MCFLHASGALRLLSLLLRLAVPADQLGLRASRRFRTPVGQWRVLALFVIVATGVRALIADARVEKVVVVLAALVIRLARSDARSIRAARGVRVLRIGHAFAIGFAACLDTFPALASVERGALRIDGARCLASAVDAHVPIGAMRIGYALDALSDGAMADPREAFGITAAGCPLAAILNAIHSGEVAFAIQVVVVAIGRRKTGVLRARDRQCTASRGGMGNEIIRSVTTFRLLRALGQHAVLRGLRDIEGRGQALTIAGRTNGNARETVGAVIRGLTGFLLLRKPPTVVIVALAATDESASGEQAQGGYGTIDQ